MAINTDTVIDAYIKLRDEKDAVEKRHKEELAPVNDKMRKIELWLQNQLQLQGLQNVKGENGTAFLQEVASISVEDRASTIAFLKDKDLWELVDLRMSKSAVRDYIESTGIEPPGVKIRRETVVRVRRG